MKTDRPMKAIPIRAGEKIAKEYGYDQVIIYARRVGEAPEPFGEHLTTYGINKTHCGVAARIGDTLKRIFGWCGTEPSEEDIERVQKALDPFFDTWNPSIREAARTAILAFQRKG